MVRNGEAATTTASSGIAWRVGFGALSQISDNSARSMDLNKLVLLGGRERTEEEFRQLLSGAGLQLVRVIQTHSPFDVIEATRT